MKEGKNEIKVVGEQRFRDDSTKIRITMDMPRLTWLILKSEIRSREFNVIDSKEETKLLESHC